jgi:hypothetical protein
MGRRLAASPRARRRAEIINCFFTQMRRGNVAATKRLEELSATATALATPKPPREEKFGKKAQAQRDAMTAEQGTSWEELLEPWPRDN